MMLCPLKFARYEFEGGEDCVGAECGFYGAVCRNDDSEPKSDVSAADVDANDGNAEQDMDMSVSVQKCSNELSECDVLHELRHYSDDVRYDYNPLDDAFEPDERLSELCGQVADMIERDYVPQANYRNMCKHIGEAHRERNELKDRIVELEKQWDARDSDCIALEAKVNRLEDEITDWSELHAQVLSERNHVIAERDELKCKLEIADRHEFESDQACDECRGHTNELLAELRAERDEWKAKAEHVDANDTCDALDSREKLEANVSKWCLSHAYGDTGYTFIIKQLDRQAAITERKHLELACAFQLESDKRITELQAKVDELTTQLYASNAERARLRECLGIATDNAHDLLTLVDESGNVYDRDEGLA